MVRVLPAGSLLRRVHRNSRPPEAFNHRARPSRLTGGRFDSCAGDYGYTYLGDSDESAIAETLCRGLPLDGVARVVPIHDLFDRSISTVEVTRDLPVLLLHGPALTQVGAPLALTKCEADEYETTRKWAASLRSWLPAIAGFQYRPRHDEDQISWVLFDDGPGFVNLRARGALRPHGAPESLTSGTGLTIVGGVLRRHRATLE